MAEDLGTSADVVIKQRRKDEGYALAKKYGVLPSEENIEQIRAVLLKEGIERAGGEVPAHLKDATLPENPPVNPEAHQKPSLAPTFAEAHKASLEAKKAANPQKQLVQTSFMQTLAPDASITPFPDPTPPSKPPESGKTQEVA